MQQTSLRRYATETAASFPSRVARISAGLRDHLDRVHRALLEAGCAARAAVVVEAVAAPDAELDHGVFGAGAETTVALEAVAAREAPAGFVHGLVRGQAAQDLAEARDSLLRLELRLL